MHVHSTEPSPWIVRFAHLVRPGGRVLDVACGAGRHTRLFAARGCTVIAADRDSALLAPLEDVSGVVIRAVDLETGAWPFAGERFDAIVVANYLHRPLFEHFASSLAADGVLLYDTFAEGNALFGKPSNPDFLLESGELVDVFGPVATIVAFEQGEVRGGQRKAVVQRLAAVGRARPWPPLLEAADVPM